MAGIFFQMNGQRLTASNAELEEFTLRVAGGGVNVDEVAEWLVGHCARGS